MLADCTLPEQSTFEFNFNTEIERIIDFSFNNTKVNIKDTDVKFFSYFYNPSSLIVSEGNSTNINKKLDEIYRECSKKNWNDEGALPISTRSLSNAKKFITYIDSFDTPDIVPYPNSDIGFSWGNTDNSLDIIFNKKDEIIYVKSQNKKISSGFFNVEDIKMAHNIVEDFCNNG